MQSTRYSRSVSIKLEFPELIFEKYSNIQFFENPSIVSGVFFMRSDGERERDVSKLIVAFRNFANAPKSDVIWEMRRR